MSASSEERDSNADNNADIGADRDRDSDADDGRDGGRDSGRDGGRCRHCAQSQRPAIELQMALYVETLTGTTFELQVMPDHTIGHIKAKLERMEGIAVSRQHLIWQDEELNNDITLEEYGIGFGATLRLVIGLRGGPLSKSPPLFQTDTDVEDSNSNGNSSHSQSQSRPLTVLIFDNGDQIKMFTISSNDGVLNKCDNLNANNLDNEPFADLDLNLNEKNDMRRKEDHIMRLKMQEIQDKMKTLALSRSKKMKVKKRDETTTHLSEKSEVQSIKLPLLEMSRNSTQERNSLSKKIEPHLHLPLITNTNSFDTNINDLILMNNSNNVNAKPVKSSKLSKRLNHLNLLQSNFNENIIKRSHTLSPKLIENKEFIHLNSITISCFPKNVKEREKQRPRTFPRSGLVTAKSGKVQDDVADNNKLEKRKKRVIALNNNISSPIKSNSQKLPPLRKLRTNTNQVRCSLCRTKLGIAMRHNCRCGLVFCVKHRYSEVHNCSYDYKEEGRKFLKLSNPLITSSKLPKI